ncbi:VanZ family protein [Streptomyces sp. NBC_01433]|uniref:VanZ family protein n=1 Tax=Streptomyces sp. NBC_01433 TaxID=2903864 RepID=UPI00225A12F4|nr:VanZ family protein [Streptomyces sp. NBC_01433]MCX4680946.1 VanZ family protein [Streptomyces sp. NBC_01433]
MTPETNCGARPAGRWRVLLRAAVLVAAFLGLVAFSVLLAKVTLTPSPASEDLVTSNLRPGRSLRQYAEDYTFLAACKQAGGNLLLGVPFGVLLPIVVPRRLRMIRMTFLTILVVIAVELVQGALVAGRAFDIDDVILNTAGALLGYLLLGRRLSHRYHVFAAGGGEAEAGRTDSGGRKRRIQAKGKAGTQAKGKRTRADGKARTQAKGKAGARGPVGAGARAAKARAGVAARARRGRELIARICGRRPGPGGGAPGPGRRTRARGGRSS